MDLVALGRGIAITAKTVSDLYQRPGVVAIPIEDIDDAELALVWSSDLDQPAVARLADAIPVG